MTACERCGGDSTGKCFVVTLHKQSLFLLATFSHRYSCACIIIMKYHCIFLVPSCIDNFQNCNTPQTSDKECF